jgi:hypothetical protein
MTNDVNTSEFEVLNTENMETLTEREEKWLQKVKAATDSRLKELAGTTEGTREQLELIVARRFAAREEDIENTPFKHKEAAIPFHVEILEDEIKEESWEERQARLKDDYDKHHGYYHWYGAVFKLNCKVCDQEFYSESPYAKYCNYWCTVARYIERRRQLHSFKKYKCQCEYCNKEFISSRVHAKYCSPSHRVLACKTRKEKTVEEKEREEKEGIERYENKLREYKENEAKYQVLATCFHCDKVEGSYLKRKRWWHKIYDEKGEYSFSLCPACYRKAERSGWLKG